MRGESTEPAAPSGRQGRWRESPWIAEWPGSGWPCDRTSRRGDRCLTTLKALAEAEQPACDNTCTSASSTRRTTSSASASPAHDAADLRRPRRRWPRLPLRGARLRVREITRALPRRFDQAPSRSATASRRPRARDSSRAPSIRARDAAPADRASGSPAGTSSPSARTTYAAVVRRDAVAEANARCRTRVRSTSGDGQLRRSRRAGRAPRWVKMPAQRETPTRPTRPRSRAASEHRSSSSTRWCFGESVMRSRVSAPEDRRAVHDDTGARAERARSSRCLANRSRVSPPTDRQLLRSLCRSSARSCLPTSRPHDQ